MAKIEEFHLNLSLPEIKLAQYLINKYKLSPGFDLFQFAKKFLQIEEINMPFNVDAIFLNLTGETGTPKILLNSIPAFTRKIFTIGHELGHYFIPWHLGSIVCNTSSFEHGQGIYWDMEGEANRFTSELLMPSNWVQELLLKEQSIRKALKKINNYTNVSLLAASFSIIKILPKGFLFVYTNEKNEVEYSARSSKTIASPPFKGTIFDPIYFERICSEFEDFSIGKSSLYWFKFEDTIKLKSVKSNKSSRELLDLFLGNLNLPLEIKIKLKQRINGVVGAANSMHNPQSSVELYSFLYQRFASKSEFAAYLDDPIFQKYLKIKANEVIG